jgi:hypothetical protein
LLSRGVVLRQLWTQCGLRCLGIKTLKWMRFYKLVGNSCQGLFNGILYLKFLEKNSMSCVEMKDSNQHTRYNSTWS